MENKDEITRIACKMVKNCVDFKQPRMSQIKYIEDTLAYVQKPALKGRLNVPFSGVIMNSFIKTLQAQTNKPPKVVFSDNKGSNLAGAQRTQAFWDEDTGPTRMQLKRKDRWSKRLCAISNLGIFEIHAESDPKYKSILNNIDHYDFIFDPTGGSNIEDHIYVGRTNIFKTLEDLSNPLYDQEQVKKLKSNTNDTTFKKNEDLYQNKVSRFASQGLSIDSNNYVGQNLYNLTELELSYNSKRYYILFDYNTGTWVRFDELKNVFESDLYSYGVWQNIEDPFNLLTPGLADMAIVIADSIEINLNEILNNNRKRNWDMKAVDSEMFPDISSLDWKQDGIVAAKVKMNQSIQNGIYRFETPEISGAMNLNSVLNSFLGINSGITDQTKGETSQSTLGQSQLDELNVSKGMKLIGDSYAECLAQIAHRWDWNQYEHLEDNYAIKILGKDGVELCSYGKKDSEPEYDITVITDDDQINEDKRAMEQQTAGLVAIAGNQILLNEIPNKKAFVEAFLKRHKIKDEELRQIMSAEENKDKITSQVNKGIEQIMLGKKPTRVPGATKGSPEIIHNYMVENSEILTPEQTTALQSFFDETAQYAEDNASKGTPEQPLPANQPVNGQPTGQPAPQGLGGTQI